MKLICVLAFKSGESKDLVCIYTISRELNNCCPMRKSIDIISGTVKKIRISRPDYDRSITISSHEFSEFIVPELVEQRTDAIEKRGQEIIDWVYSQSVIQGDHIEFTDYNDLSIPHMYIVLEA